MKRKKLIIFAILLIIITFHIINNYIIASRDLAQIFYDGGDYISISFKVYVLLSQHRFLDAFLTNAGGYTSFFVSLSYPFYAFFGLNQKSAIMTNFIFLTILVFSTYGIGKVLYSKRAGILSAFLVMSFPGVFSLSRTYLFDFALIAMVTLSFYCLLKTKNFTRRTSSVFLGLAVGLSIVIRPSFIVFFLAPFCYYLFLSFKEMHKELLFKKIKNFIIFLIPNLSLVGIFYLPTLSGKINYQLHVMSTPAHPIKLNYLSPENILFYLKGILGVQILYFFFILFCIFSVIMFLRNNKKNKILLFLWFLVPYLFFTFYVLNNKSFRHIAPYLPAIALIISISLFEIKKVSIRRVLIFLTVFIGLFQFVSISYISSANYFIDSLNEKFFDLPPFFSAPAYIVDMEGHPHAYETDYGLNHIAEVFKSLDKISEKNKITFVDYAGQITRPLQYLIPQNNADLLKKEIIYDDIINKPSQVEINYGNRTLRFVKPPSIDIMVLSSDSYEFINLEEFMKLTKVINLEPNKSLYVFEKI